MDFRARPRDVSARCPYCHDTLDGGPADERVECVACGTSHHMACVAELGRCTVHGCERPFFGMALERARAGARRSSAWLAVRARIQDRVRSYVRAHARAPSSPIEARAAHEAAMLTAAEASGARDRPRAADALREAARALESGRELDLDWAWRAPDPDELRARARRLEERHEAARALRRGLQFVGAVALAIAVAGLIVTAARLG